jgi:hypothetical protein
VSPRRSPLAGFPPLALSACVPSLNRFYVDRDITFEPSLLGSWIDERRRHVWCFAPGCNQNYRLSHTDEESRTSEFVVHLFRVEGIVLIDLWPWNFDAGMNPLHALHILPAHNAMLVRQLHPELHVAFLSYASVRQTLEKDATAVAHVCPRNNEYVLTAPPHELQRFITRHDKKARTSIFGSMLELTRQPTGLTSRA